MRSRVEEEGIRGTGKWKGGEEGRRRGGEEKRRGGGEKEKMNGIGERGRRGE